MTKKFKKNQVLTLLLHLCPSSVARRRCAQGQLQRWFSPWWMEQMAASSALDTPSWVTHTHTHTQTGLHNQCKCLLWVTQSACLCVSLLLGCVFAGPHLSEGEGRGLDSADAKSVLRLLLLCFRLDLFNPAEAASSKNCLAKGRDLLMRTTTKTHMHTFKPTCSLIQVQHPLFLILFGCLSFCIW